MRWSHDPRIRTAARRGAGIALLVLGLGFFLVLDWAGAAPREVVPPEGGGHALEASASTGGGKDLLVGVDEGRPGARQASATNPAARRGAAADTTDAQPQPKAVKAFNPLTNLVDGTGFVRFLGFTAISLGFAVVILVFFWSHRRDPLS